MKLIGAGLLWLASAAGAAAYFPVDIENQARWVVLDDLPLLANGKPLQTEITRLRTNDIITQPVLVSAVCGTLDFHNTDDGVANFVVFYSVDDNGNLAMVGRPFLYGRVSARNFELRYDAAVEFCGSDEGTAVAKTGADTGTATAVETGVAAETEAAAVAKRE